MSRKAAIAADIFFRICGAGQPAVMILASTVKNIDHHQDFIKLVTPAEIGKHNKSIAYVEFTWRHAVGGVTRV